MNNIYNFKILSPLFFVVSRDGAIIDSFVTKLSALEKANSLNTDKQTGFPFIVVQLRPGTYKKEVCQD